MTTSEWISVIALIISSGGFAIQARNWFMSGPRLNLSLMADARTFPDDGQGKRLALIVINRGDTPTMLTHMVSYTYETWWKKYRRRSKSAGVVNVPGMPTRLDVNGNWIGQMIYDDDTTDAREKGTLYIGVIASHKDGAHLVKVPAPSKFKPPTKQIAS